MPKFRPYDCQCNDERGRRGERRPAAGRKPQQQREQQRDLHRSPMIRAVEDGKRAHHGYRHEPKAPSMASLCGGGRARRRNSDQQRCNREDAECVGCEPVVAK